MIFDTHAHYDDPQFAEDKEQVLTAFAEAGIGCAVNVASTVASMDECVRLAETWPQLYCAVGVHPSECGEMTERDLAHMRDLLSRPRTLAIGEIGLDYHYDGPSRELQQHWFRRQLETAAETDMPVIIHSRDAAEDTMHILQEFYPSGQERKRPSGVIHCYSYSPEMAEIFVAMGFYIGVGGVLTFKNAKKLKETVRRLPLGKLVLETDCPYMAPEPHRGERNSSLLLPYVAAAMAEIRGISRAEVIRVTEENARHLYGIDRG